MFVCQILTLQYQLWELGLCLCNVGELHKSMCLTLYAEVLKQHCQALVVPQEMQQLDKACDAPTVSPAHAKVQRHSMHGLAAMQRPHSAHPT